MPEYHAEPLFIIRGTFAHVSTLFRFEGMSKSPLTDVRMYLGQGSPTFPSMELMRALDSPDTKAPALTLPGDITAEATGVSTPVEFTAEAEDAEDPTPAVVCLPESGSGFGLGATTVNCTATDGAGNSSSGSFTVTVVDTTAPTLNLPAPTVEATGEELLARPRFVPSWKPYWPKLKTISLTFPEGIAFLPDGRFLVTERNLGHLRSGTMQGRLSDPIEGVPEVFRYEGDTNTDLVLPLPRPVGKGEAVIVDTWWQTETGGFLCSTMPGIHKMKPGSAGPAIPGIHPVIYDDEGKELPAGSGKAGNICIRNPWPGGFQTIWKDPERFVRQY